jgi:hypothetical protein
MTGNHAGAGKSGQLDVAALRLQWPERQPNRIGRHQSWPRALQVFCQCRGIGWVEIGQVQQHLLCCLGDRIVAIWHSLTPSSALRYVSSTGDIAVIFTL